MRGALGVLLVLDPFRSFLRLDEKAISDRRETIHATFAPNAAMYKKTGMRFSIASTRRR